MGVERKGGHPAATDELGVDGPGRAGQDELLLGIDGPGPGDDDQVGAQGPRREREIDGVGIGLQRGDERAGAIDPRRSQHIVTSAVAHQVGVFEVDDPVGDVVDDDHLGADVLKVLARRTAHSAVSADDDVTAHPGDPLVHPTPFEVLPDLTLGDRADHDGEVVERDADPEDH